MNTRKDVLYDKHAVGNRIRASRKSIGLSRAQMAELIGKSEKYYADIERGYCGMSLETMIEISRRLGFSLDYLVNGEETAGMTENATKVLFYLGQCDEKQHKKVAEILQVLARG